MTMHVLETLFFLLSNLHGLHSQQPRAFSFKFFLRLSKKAFAAAGKKLWKSLDIITLGSKTRLQLKSSFKNGIISIYKGLFCCPLSPASYNLR